MLSVQLEPSLPPSPHGPKARQDRAAPSSDGFSALVDSNASAPESDPKQAPSPDGARADVRSKRGGDTSTKGQEASPAAASAHTSDGDSVPEASASLEQITVETNDGDPSGKKPDAVKLLTDEKTPDSKDGSADQANVDVVAQPAPALAPGVLAITTVIAAAPEPTATPAPRAETPPAPAAIAAAAAITVAATVAATAPQPPVKTGDTEIKPTATSEVSLPADVDNAAETTAILSPAMATAPAKGEAALKSEALTPGKDTKPATGKSAKPIIADQDAKPATDDVTAADPTPSQDKPAAKAKTETDPAAPAETAAPSPARIAQSAVPTPQPHAAQPDQILQPLSQLPQPPAQSHLANLTAIPVSAAQAPLTANTPVPVSGLAVDIALRAAGGSSRFEIRLDPAELGRIDVRLDVDKHGNVTSHLTVERPATLDMLRKDAPQLQQALEDAGLKTGDSGLQFSLRDQSSSGRDNDHGSGRNSQRLVIAEDDTVPAQSAGRTYSRSLLSSSGVDIRI